MAQVERRKAEDGSQKVEAKRRKADGWPLEVGRLLAVSAQVATSAITGASRIVFLAPFPPIGGQIRPNWTGRPADKRRWCSLLAAFRSGSLGAPPNELGQLERAGS